MASEQNASEQQHEYGASDITVLEGLGSGFASAPACTLARPLSAVCTTWSTRS